MSGRTRKAMLKPPSAYCNILATHSSGRVAIVAHTRASDGMQVATKYAHLAQNGFPRAIAEALASNRQQCEQAVNNPNPVRCSLDSGKWVAVAKGDQIGSIGNSGRGREDDGFDDHVHFEILHLNVPMSLWTDNRGSWYDMGSARNCIVGYEPKGQSTTEELLHCTWDPAMGDRVMWPVLGRRGLSTTTAGVFNADQGRRCCWPQHRRQAARRVDHSGNAVDGSAGSTDARRGPDDRILASNLLHEVLQ